MQNKTRLNATDKLHVMFLSLLVISCLSLTLIFVLVPTTALSQEAQTTDHCPTLSQRPLPLIKIAEGTYVRKGLHQIFNKQNLAAIANIGFVIGEKSIAVIDTGGSFCDGHRLLTAIRKISQKPISHVINTHTHPDHVFGNAAFQPEQPEYVGHHNLKRALANRGMLYLENLKRIMGEDQLTGTKIVLPTLEVQTTTTIDLGNRKLILKAYDTAHTDHDLTVFDPDNKIIWTGDLLFVEHIPVIVGSILGWQKRMEELKKIPATMVVPGHGGPFLLWPKALENQQHYLEQMTKDLREIIKEGGTMLEAQQQAGKSEKSAWQLFEEFNARNAAAGFAELEWE